MENKDKSSALCYDLPGSITTRQNKATMVNMTSERFVSCRRMVFFESFVVTQTDSASLGDVRQEIEHEMRSFSEHINEQKTRDGSVEGFKSFSGKKINVNDDFVMAIIICVYGHDTFNTKAVYKDHRWWVLFLSHYDGNT